MLPTSTQAPIKAFLSECPFRASSCRPVLGCHRFNAFTRGNLSAGHLCYRIHMFLFSALTVSRLPHRTPFINNIILWLLHKSVPRSQTPLTEIYPLKNLKTEPPKTFSQNLLVVSPKIRKFVATYKRSAKVRGFPILNKHCIRFSLIINIF